MRVGFIGLGRMGYPMAKNLIKAGHEVVAHNRSRAPAERLAACGAAVADSPAELAAAVDVVVSCVMDPRQLETVLLGPRGVVEAARPGLLCVDCSTVDPLTSRAVAAALAEKGVDFVDAPVSGGPRGAEAGTLTVMVGAEPAALERALPVLRAFGSEIVHFGPVGAGVSAKLCNQILTGTIHALVAEAMVLGAKLGLDPRRLYEALRASSGQSRALERSVPEAILPRNFAAVFTVDGMVKDLDCAIRAAEANGVRLRLPELARSIYREAQARGHGGEHLSAVILAMEEAAGVVVAEKRD